MLASVNFLFTFLLLLAGQQFVCFVVVGQQLCILTTRSRTLYFKLFICSICSCIFRLVFGMLLYFLDLILVSIQEKRHQERHTHILNIIYTLYTYVYTYVATKTIAT